MQLPPQMLQDLSEWLRIPSISTSDGYVADIRRAAEWTQNFLERYGANVEIVEAKGAPIVLGELKANRENAPTVMIYGHYDVQGIGEINEWHTDPFDPVVKDGRLYARGSADDKGNFFPLMQAACDLYQEGKLPVNVRVVVEGEEEVGSGSLELWLEADERGADCAILFDSMMADENTPAICIATRGIITAQIKVTACERELHSGVYGGSAMNAANVLTKALSKLLADENGLLPAQLRIGATAISEAERESWKHLPAGSSMLRVVNTIPADDRAAEEFYLRTGGLPSIDINGLASDHIHDHRSVIPGTAQANISMRTVPGQSSAAMEQTLRQLIRDSLPSSVQLADWQGHVAEPSYFDPESAPLRIARKSFAKSCGVEPALMRLGGSLPILSALADRQIPSIVTGFALPEDNFHSPNESYRLESLRMGLIAARGLLEDLSALAPASAGVTANSSRV